MAHGSQIASRAEESAEILAGLVERVVFHNPENGFCVLRVEARGQREPVTVVGHAALISAGEFIQASGSWANDRTHGVQFRASFLKATQPTSKEAIEKYLASRMRVFSGRTTLTRPRADARGHPLPRCSRGAFLSKLAKAIRLFLTQPTER